MVNNSKPECHSTRVLKVFGDGMFYMFQVFLDGFVSTSHTTGAEDIVSFTMNCTRYRC